MWRREREEPISKAPFIVREGYRAPPRNDSLADPARQLGFGVLRGAGGAPGNLLDLAVRAGSWVANRLGAPREVAEQAGALTKQIFNLPTSQDINQRFVDMGVDPYAQPTLGRIAGQGAEAVGGAAALGVLPAALAALGLGGAAGTGAAGDRRSRMGGYHSRYCH